MLLFVISFFMFVKSIFQQSYPPTYKAGIEWCCLWFLSLFDVLEYFFSPTHSHPIKQGLSDVLLFVIPMFGLKSIFQQSYPPHL
jgi:hypothetical protein